MNSREALNGILELRLSQNLIFQRDMDLTLKGFQGKLVLWWMRLIAKQFSRTVGFNNATCSLLAILGFTHKE